jgi:hypothetical protein
MPLRCLVPMPHITCIYYIDLKLFDRLSSTTGTHNKFDQTRPDGVNSFPAPQTPCAPAQYSQEHLVCILLQPSPTYTSPTLSPTPGALSETGQHPGHPDQPAPAQAPHSHSAARAQLARTSLGTYCSQRARWVPIGEADTLQPDPHSQPWGMGGALGTGHLNSGTVSARPRDGYATCR